jgi:predicted nucleotidyltransferase
MIVADKQEVLEQLAKSKDRLFAKYGIVELAILGSLSREAHTADSDIDILVDFSGEIGIEFIDLAEELEEMLDKRVDLVSKKGVKDKYFDCIKDDLIYV